jgi:hypothetical protein
MFYTRLNHLIFAISLVAWLLPLRARAMVGDFTGVLAQVRLRLAWAYAGVFAAGVSLFMLRTWWYTGVLSLFYGTSLKNNDTGLRVSTIASSAVWGRIAHSLGALVWMNEPPNVDPRAVVVVTGVLASALAILQVPVMRQLPAALVIVTAGAMASALFVHTHNYPGRMSITLVPLASAATVLAVTLVVGRALSPDRHRESGPR